MSCDIHSAVTPGHRPFRFDELLADGRHINRVRSHAAGAREADSALMARASISVDALQALEQDAGDILISLHEACISREQIRGKIGQFLAGEIPGRHNEKEMTLYKSVGFASQDLRVAQWLNQQAQQQDVGLGISCP